MAPTLSCYAVDDVRAAERAALDSTPEGSLMQRAAAGLAAVCARELRSATGGIAGRRAVLLVGSGSNGGDAFWAGVRLRARGVAVTALLTTDGAHAEGLAALRAVGGRAVPVPAPPGPAELDLLAAADLVVDGLVGLGGKPGLREPAAALVAALPPRAVVVAVDLPSGVDVDTGATPSGHVTADVTVTFGAAKNCLLLPPASTAAGRVELVDIGLRLGSPAVERLGPGDVARLWPVPAPGADKYRRGVLGMVVGSAGYPGAAVLSTAGALRAGVGMVRYVGPDSCADAVRAAHPEAVVGVGRVQAWALGSGVDPEADDDQPARIRDALDSGLPCLLDAGALSVWRPGPDPDDASDRLLLTPHAGELATLLSRSSGSSGSSGSGEDVSRADVEARPYEHALRAARRTGACVLLKGGTTLVVLPSGVARSQAAAPPWLATAGAGDVLGGIAGALLAAGLSPLDAGSVAAQVHGRAAALAAGSGTTAGGPITAMDVAAAVPRAVAEALAHP